MMLTTGILMFGKMSVGVRKIESDPRIKIRIASTTNVYVRLSATLTIHMIHPPNLFVRRGRTVSTKMILRPVLRGPGIQGRDHLLGCWRHGERSGENNLPRGDLPAVHTAVVTIVRADGRAFQGDSSKQATRPGVAQDFGTQSRIRIG